MDKRELLDRCRAVGEDRMLLARVLDKLEQARRKNIPACTGFLSESEQALAEPLVRLAGGEDRCVCTGGFAGAERKMLCFLPDWLEEEDFLAGQVPIRFLRCTYRPDQGLTHRDLLGSLMGLGLVREKIGDLLVAEGSCDLAVAESVADFLLQSWTSAGRASLRVTEIGVENLHIPQARVRELRDTVMRLRLDAVAATGFGLSRTKAAELIASGRVQVNHRECTKGDQLLAQGDVVTARGFGKFELSQVGGQSRKGRTAIVVKRYL